MKKRFCPYGQHFVDDVGFIFKMHAKSMTKRGMCPSCQAKRKLPRAVLDRMTKEEKEARRATVAAASKQALEKRKEGL
jgi:hypothetical protein